MGDFDVSFCRVLENLDIVLYVCIANLLFLSCKNQITRQIRFHSYYHLYNSHDQDGTNVDKTKLYENTLDCLLKNICRN